MKNSLLVYIDQNCTDSDLTFNDKFIPEELEKKLPEFKDITDLYFSLPQSYNGKLTDKKNSLVRKGNDISSWKELISEISTDNIIKIYGDSPFLDISLINEMIETHTKYLAEFTYSENLPEGFTSEIYSTELIKELPDQTEMGENQHSLLSTFIKKNINQFDVELFYKGPDLRSKRVSFRSSNPRDKRVMENICTINNGIPAYGEVKSLIEDNPAVLYIGPSYLELEITGKSEIETIYSYNKVLDTTREEMNPAVVDKILADMKDFNLPYAVTLGGSGDPLNHPNFYEIMNKLLGDDNINEIIIETDGIKADESFSGFISETDDNRIKVIVEMNGHDEKSYEAIHGANLFEKVKTNILNLKNALKSPENSLYIQIMKINETEEFLDLFYDFWEKHDINIILQKYNTYLSLLEDKKYYDLTPLERIPCWHLQRDLFILSNGTVGFCKQDISGKYSSCNLNEKSVSEIWNSKKEMFLNNYKGNLSKSPDCSLCDEWYTFNL